MSLFKKNDDQQEWFIPEESRTYLKETFGKMKRDVHMEVYLSDTVNAEYCEFTRKFTNDLDRLGEKIHLTLHELDSSQAEKRGVTTAPVTLFNPDELHVRFFGAPAGEEGRAFLETILMLSFNVSGLSAASLELIKELNEERLVEVFVSPTCPYCPGQAMNAIRAAVEKPDLVKVEVVEGSENPERAEKYNVGSVPHTVINETLSVLGMEPQERFMVELVTLKSAEEWLKEQGLDRHGQTLDDSEAESVDVIVIGGGPAGLSAAIYAQRAGLSTVVLEKANLGGQIAVTPVVENYPGFQTVQGSQLVEILGQHARQYADVREFEEVLEIKIGKRIEVYTPGTLYYGKALIFATGANWKDLGVPGEKKFSGNGVSHCASCDGFLYKDSKVIIVGGGNTAATDALYLKNLGADVTLIHRRDELRAEKHLQKSLEKENIPILWNTVVEEIMGDVKLTGLRIRNVVDEQTSELECDGVFVAVGETANTKLAKEIGIAVDDYGNIKVDEAQRTNISRIYAAGDNTGGVRQIVTATSEGAVAATTVFEDLNKLDAE